MRAQGNNHQKDYHKISKIPEAVLTDITRQILIGVK